MWERKKKKTKTKPKLTFDLVMIFLLRKAEHEVLIALSVSKSKAWVRRVNFCIPLRTPDAIKGTCFQLLQTEPWEREM